MPRVRCNRCKKITCLDTKWYKKEYENIYFCKDCRQKIFDFIVGVPGLKRTSKGIIK